MTTPISADPLQRAIIEHLKLREGVRKKVYKDSLGKLTVGVGHLVRPEDNLKLGDEISDERINSLLAKDLDSAFLSALKRCNHELPFLTGDAHEEMLAALTHVNFQLGNNWPNVHKNTWRLITLGKFKEAAEEVKDSLWYAQTPVRVNDFSKALLSIDKMLRENTNDTTKSTTR